MRRRRRVSWAAVALVGLVVGAIAVGAIACRSAEPSSGTSTATASPEPTATAPIDILPTQTATPVPPPTATPFPPAAANGLWAFDLALGIRTVLHEGDEVPLSRVEGSGDTITATLTDGAEVTALRLQPDGQHLEEHADRGMITSSANGESRFYLDLADVEDPQLVLEHQGEIVRLEGTRPRTGLSFSPAGDRLLAVSDRPGTVDGEEVRTFSVHSTADGRLRMQFEHRASIGTPPVAIWSPSGRYVADRGIEGLFVRDTVSGRAWRLGPSGSARWSPIADQLLVVTDFGRLSIVNVPELDGVDLGPGDPTVTVLFDRSGQLAIATTYEDPDTRTGPTTRAFAVDSGDEVAVWTGVDASSFAVGGRHPVALLDDGIAAVFTASAGCEDGFVLYHPALSDNGRCVAGTNPRWSPRSQYLVFAREREIVLLSIAEDDERVLTRGTPPAAAGAGPVLRWSPDGSWILIQWPWDLPADPAAAD